MSQAQPDTACLLPIKHVLCCQGVSQHLSEANQCNVQSGGGEPNMTRQTSWLESTGECIGRQMTLGLHCAPKRGNCGMLSATLCADYDLLHGASCPNVTPEIKTSS